MNPRTPPVSPTTESSPSSGGVATPAGGAIPQLDVSPKKAISSSAPPVPSTGSSVSAPCSSLPRTRSSEAAAAALAVERAYRQAGLNVS